MHSKISNLGLFKKLIIFIALIFILSSCWDIEEEKIVINEKITCESPYQIWTIDKTNLKLKWVIVSDDIKTVSSPMAWTVDYLNCNAGKTVYKNTLIAKVSPDFNNPNITNLSIQKSSLISQKTNLESLKTTTINNLDSQISDIKSQIILLKNNVKLTQESWNLSKLDLEKQIEGLEDNYKSLEKNLKLLNETKINSLEKIEISKKTTYSNILNLVKDNLLKIDETFWITTENKRLNDKYEDYLWKKNTILLREIKTNFIKLNSEDIKKMSETELSLFLEKLINLNNEVQKSVKASIENVYFSKTQIDLFYNLFLNYSKNINDLKNAWDSISNSIELTNRNFDTQISSLENQIKTTETNLENLKTNKTWSVNTSNKLQLSNLDAQLKTLNTNLNNLISNKKTQLLNLDNQILQINQNIASLNTNLQSRNIYAKINWTIKQKISSNWNNVWLNSPLCQIIPNTKSTKIKIFSPIELNLWDKLLFNFNSEKYEIIIENVLIYKDPATQNYVYESNYLDKKYFKDGEILSLEFKSPLSQPFPQGEKGVLENKIIKVPLSYIRNKIDWNFVKAKTASWITEVKVELWDINGSIVEIEKGIEGIEEICK